jgi:hypothetical protein
MQQDFADFFFADADCAANRDPQLVRPPVSDQHCEREHAANLPRQQQAHPHLAETVAGRVTTSCTGQRKSPAVSISYSAPPLPHISRRNLRPAAKTDRPIRQRRVPLPPGSSKHGCRPGSYLRPRLHRFLHFLTLFMPRLAHSTA